MAKRFVDSDIFQSPFFDEMPPEYKLFFFYLIVNSGHSGIWKVNMKLARFQTGIDSLDEQKALEYFNYKKTRVMPIKNGEKWFLVNWVSRQQGGKISMKNPCHRSIIKEYEQDGIEFKLIDNTDRKADIIKEIPYTFQLLHRGFIGASEPLPTPYEGGKVIVKDKVIVKVKVKVKDKNKEIAKLIIEYFNTVTGKNYKVLKSNLKYINPRIDEGHSLDDFKLVVDLYHAKWSREPKFSEYIRPSTLFNEKFNERVQEALARKAKKSIGNHDACEPDEDVEPSRESKIDYWKSKIEGNLHYLKTIGIDIESTDIPLKDLVIEYHKKDKSVSRRISEYRNAIEELSELESEKTENET